MKFPAVMIDLETLGTRSNAAIVQIGMVAFSYEPGLDTEGMKVNVDPGNIRHPFSADWDTIKWWLTQDLDARVSITRTALSPNIAAKAVIQFFTKYCNSNADVWACGSAFDLPILENLILSQGMQSPWKFWRVHDMRTIALAVPDLKRITPTVAHDARADAEAQAEFVARAMKELHGKRRKGTA